MIYLFYAFLVRWVEVCKHVTGMPRFVEVIIFLRWPPQGSKESYATATQNESRFLLCS